MRRWLCIASALSLIAATSAAVQFDAPAQPISNDSVYDGRFTFVRLRWKSDLGTSRFGGFGGAAWNHDFPRAERNLALILKELTALDVRTDGSLVLALDDPELFKYPIAFMWDSRTTTHPGG